MPAARHSAAPPRSRAGSSEHASSSNSVDETASTGTPTVFVAPQGGQKRPSAEMACAVPPTAPLPWLLERGAATLGSPDGGEHDQDAGTPQAVMTSMAEVRDLLLFLGEDMRAKWPEMGGAKALDAAVLDRSEPAERLSAKRAY